MLHAKISGSAVAAVAALMVFAGTALATQLTSPAGTTYTGSLHAESEGHVVFREQAGLEYQCASTLATSVQQHGTGLTVAGNVSEFSVFNCTNAFIVKTLQKGAIEIHPIAGTDNGTVTSSGLEMEFKPTELNAGCRYYTLKTDIGTLTGTDITGGTAVIDVSVTLLRSGGGAFCSPTITWTGKYKIRTPDSLLVDP